MELVAYCPLYHYCSKWIVCRCSLIFRSKHKSRFRDIYIIEVIAVIMNDLKRAAVHQQVTEMSFIQHSGQLLQTWWLNLQSWSVIKLTYSYKIWEWSICFSCFHSMFPSVCLSISRLAVYGAMTVLFFFFFSEHMIYLVAGSENGGDPSKFQFFRQSVCPSCVKFCIRAGLSSSLKVFEPKSFNYEFS